MDDSKSVILETSYDKWIVNKTVFVSLIIVNIIFASVMVQDLRKMVDRIRKFQLLNDQIFASLNRYLIPGHDRVRPAFGVVTEHFTPPSFKT